MTRTTINAGTWQPETRPAPVQYVVQVDGQRVHFSALHTSQHDGRQTCAHGMALTADEARTLGRALLLAGMELA